MTGFIFGSSGSWGWRFMYMARGVRLTWLRLVGVTCSFLVGYLIMRVSSNLDPEITQSNFLETYSLKPAEGANQSNLQAIIYLRPAEKLNLSHALATLNFKPTDGCSPSNCNLTELVQDVEFASRLDKFELQINEESPLVKAAAANAAHAARFGAQRVFPASFSLPTIKFHAIASPESMFRLSMDKKYRWSPMVPGNRSTYVYSTEAAYMTQYSESWMAATFRKGGVDCLRHVEIIAAGCIPVFRNSKCISHGTMVGYPFKLLRYIEANQAEADPAVLRLWLALLRRWSLRHLTSLAMVQYMATVAGVGASFMQPPSNPEATYTTQDCILFVDDSLPKKVNYLAVLTLVGLVEAVGAARVHVLAPPLYMYNDSTAKPKTLYGLGYGYARLLPTEARFAQPSREIMEADLIAGNYGLVVYGSIYRKTGGKTLLAEAVRAYTGRPERLWLCHGGDWKPSAADYGPNGSLLANISRWHESVTLFVREWPFEESYQTPHWTR